MSPSSISSQMSFWLEYEKKYARKWMEKKMTPLYGWNEMWKIILKIVYTRGNLLLEKIQLFVPSVLCKAAVYLMYKSEKRIYIMQYLLYIKSCTVFEPFAKIPFISIHSYEKKSRIKENVKKRWKGKTRLIRILII